MNFAILTYDGASLPLAKQLLDEGNTVIVGQVKDNDILVGWMGDTQSREEKKRRLSIYDGIVDKLDAVEFSKKLRSLADKNKQDDWFVLVDHNQIYKYSERYIRWGFKGLLPDTEDMFREKDRAKAQEFVKDNYRNLHVIEGEEYKKVADGIKLVTDSDDFWVLKSNGNILDTVVPRTKSLDLNHQQILGALKSDPQGYEKGGFLLEKQIIDPVEFTPVLGFWDGELVYSHIEFENKQLGAGNTGPDGGGAVNLTIRTDLDSDVNKIFFPQIVYSMARKRKGLFIFDAGILYNPADDQYYFTEFAGNRWGWGGIFSEMIMSKKGKTYASNYFESVIQQKNPLTQRYGATVTMYNVVPDRKYPDVHMQDIPIYSLETNGYAYLFQVKHNDKGQMVNVGMGSYTLGYASASGNVMGSVVDRVYDVVDSISFDKMLYRPKEDFLSKAYPEALMSRVEKLEELGLL